MIFYKKRKHSSLKWEWVEHTIFYLFQAADAAADDDDADDDDADDDDDEYEYIYIYTVVNSGNPSTIPHFETNLTPRCRRFFLAGQAARPRRSARPSQTSPWIGPTSTSGTSELFFQAEESHIFMQLKAGTSIKLKWGTFHCHIWVPEGKWEQINLQAWTSSKVGIQLDEFYWRDKTITV